MALSPQKWPFVVQPEISLLPTTCQPPRWNCCEASLTGSWTRALDAYEAMRLLQEAGVRAGVCQTAADKVERDVQLKQRDYYVELDHSEMGRWPVENLPLQMSRTPIRAGRPTERAAPCYGEDTDEVLGELLGLSAAEIRALEEQGVVGNGSAGVAA